VSPRERYAADELAGVEAFTDAGGRLLVMGDPPTVELSGGLFFGSLEPVASRTSSLGSTYGIAYGTGYLYNMEENDNNFKSIFARPAGESALTDGVDRVVMREAVPIRTGDATDVMVGSQGTHLSETRDAGQYAVVARNGNVVAVGDTDFVSRENAYDADNEALIGNIADFLVDGDKESGAPADPERGRERPSDGVPPRGDPAPTPPPS
jgi:hypothetical protein